MILKACKESILKTNYNYIFKTLSFFSMDNEKKDQYGRPFPNYNKYPAPVLTVDAVVIRDNKDNKEPEILMCTRGIDPFKGRFVFPGGHVDYNEAPERACIRELKEETNMDGSIVELLTVKGDPQRDPRKHIVTIAYLVKVSEDQEPKGGDDASDAKFYPLKDVVQQPKNVGFDHIKIIEDAIKRLNLSVTAQANL